MQKAKIIVVLFTSLLLVAGCVSIPTGDGGKLKISKSGLEIEDKDGEKSEMTFDTDEGGYTIETDGNVAKAGSNAEIPKDFPNDILLPKEATLILSNEIDDNSYMLSYQVEGQMTDEHTIYADYLNDNGYEVHEINMEDTIISYQGRKENDHFLHYQMSGNEDNTYNLSILYGKLD